MNKIFATILMIFGVFLTIGGFGDGNILGIIIGAAMAVSGNFFRTKALTEEAKQNQQRFFPQQPKIEINDDFIIRLANRLNKRLSVEDLVAQTTLGRDEAKNRLESMSQKGICEIRLTDVENSGKIYYYFD